MILLKKMNNPKKNFKRIGVIGGLVLVLAGSNLMTQASSAITKYYNKEMTITLKDKAGYKKITNNGKKIKIKEGIKSKKIKCKSGKYVLKTLNKQGISKTITVYIDKKKPTVKGVRNLASYEKATIKVSDNIKLQEVRLDGAKKGTSFQVTKEGTHTVTAKDKAGNKTSVTFIIRKKQVTNHTTPSIVNTPVPISTQGAEIVVKPTIIPENTPENVIIEPTKTVISTTIVPTTVITHTEAEQPTPQPTIVTNTNAPAVPTIPTNITVTPATPQKSTPTPTEFHKWEVKSVVDKSLENCKKLRTTTYYCSECWQEKTEEVVVEQHNFQMIPENPESKKSDATCTEPSIYYYTCSVCNKLSEETYVFGKALGHNYKEGYITGEKEQIIEEKSCSHGTKYKLACKNENCTEKYSNETWVAPDQLAHEYTEKSMTQDYLKSAADCENDAVYWYKCKNCNTSAKNVSTELTESKYSYTVENTKKGHKWEKPYASEYQYDNSDKHIVSGKTGNCVIAPFYYKKCQVCQKYADDLGYTTEEFMYQGKAKGSHNMRVDTNNKRTLVDKGNCVKKASYYEICKDCGFIDTTKAVESELYGNHEFAKKNPDEKHKHTEATCKNQATYYKQCTYCEKYADELGTLNEYYPYGSLVTSTTDTKGHTGLDSGQMLAHDCTQSRYHCSDCNRDIIEKNGNSHNFILKLLDATYLKKAPTLYEKAEYWYKCDKCTESSQNSNEKKSYEGTALDSAAPQINVSVNQDNRPETSTTFNTYAYGIDYYANINVYSTYKGKVLRFFISVQDQKSLVGNTEYLSGIESIYYSFENYSESASWNETQALQKVNWKKIDVVDDENGKRNYNTYMIPYTEPNDAQVLYVKAVDKAGNVSVVRSQYAYFN